MGNKCYENDPKCIGSHACAFVRCIHEREQQQIKEARLYSCRSIISRAMAQPAQKDDISDLMDNALRLRAILFKDWCDSLPPAYKLGKTTPQLYEDFSVRLQSAAPVPIEP